MPWRSCPPAGWSPRCAGCTCWVRARRPLPHRLLPDRSLAAGGERARPPGGIGRAGRAVRGAAGRRHAGARAGAARRRGGAGRAAPAAPQAVLQRAPALAASRRALPRVARARAGRRLAAPPGRRADAARRRRRRGRGRRRRPRARRRRRRASCWPRSSAGRRSSEVDAPPGLAGRWRVTQAIEAVAYPTDAEAMARRVLGLQAAPCPWCGEPHAALPCALCGHDRNRALTRQEIAV